MCLATTIFSCIKFEGDGCCKDGMYYRNHVRVIRTVRKNVTTSRSMQRTEDRGFFLLSGFFNMYPYCFLASKGAVIREVHKGHSNSC